MVYYSILLVFITTFDLSTNLSFVLVIKVFITWNWRLVDCWQSIRSLGSRHWASNTVKAPGSIDKFLSSFFNFFVFSFTFPRPEIFPMRFWTIHSTLVALRPKILCQLCPLTKGLEKTLQSDWCQCWWAKVVTTQLIFYFLYL